MTSMRAHARTGRGVMEGSRRGDCRRTKEVFEDEGEARRSVYLMAVVCTYDLLLDPLCLGGRGFVASFSSEVTVRPAEDRSDKPTEGGVIRTGDRVGDSTTISSRVRGSRLVSLNISGGWWIMAVVDGSLSTEDKD